MQFNNIIEKRNLFFEDIKHSVNIVFWGAGAKGKQTAEILRKEGIYPTVYVDNNAKLQGKTIDVENGPGGAIQESYHTRN